MDIIHTGINNGDNHVMTAGSNVPGIGSQDFVKIKLPAVIEKRVIRICSVGVAVIHRLRPFDIGISFQLLTYLEHRNPDRRIGNPDIRKTPSCTHRRNRPYFA